MKTKLNYIFIVLLIISIIYSINITKKYYDLKPSTDSIQIAKKENCKIEEILEQVDGVSMEPMIRNWEKLKLLKNYYQCEWKLQRWDLVYFDSIITHWAVIKKLSVLPGDIVKFENGKMILNWEKLKNSAWQEYNFSQKEIKTMFPFVQSWYMQSGSYFIFWDNVTNSIDSRVYGWVWSEDFLGKFLIK